jgi:hypothetical protein
MTCTLGKNKTILAFSAAIAGVDLGIKSTLGSSEGNTFKPSQLLLLSKLRQTLIPVNYYGFFLKTSFWIYSGANNPAARILNN